MAKKREVVVGSVMGSKSVLASEEGAAIKVVETKLTGQLRKGLTAGVHGVGRPNNASPSHSVARDGRYTR